MKYTPENIETLQHYEVFVFGSNLAGVHGAGAAALAFKKFGARWGKGEGFAGNSYAIPTKDFNIKTLSLKQIEYRVHEFIRFAMYEPGKVFLVTKIGCGLAGLTVKDIAPLFASAKDVTNIILPKEFYEANG